MAAVGLKGLMYSLHQFDRRIEVSSIHRNVDDNLACINWFNLSTDKWKYSLIARYASVSAASSTIGLSVCDSRHTVSAAGSVFFKDDHRRRISTCVCVWACSATDIRKVSEIFARMFHDPQTKVLSVFVETVVDLIAVHADDLTQWLPILLPRLFLKLTSDLRGSIHAKIQQALQAVRCQTLSFYGRRV